MLTVKSWFQLYIKIVICSRLVFGQNPNFVLDFFTEIKQLRYSVVFTCPDYQLDSLELFEKFSNANIRSSFVQITSNTNVSVSIKKILRFKQYGSCGVVVNCACKGYDFILSEASKYQYFNLSYEWLIVDPLNLGVDTILTPVFNISVNSLMTFVEPEINGTCLTLIDIYSRGRHLQNELFLQRYATWCPDTGVLDLVNLPPLYHKLYRGNFENLTLRAGTVIDRDNVRLDDADRILSEPGFTEGVTPFMKHYHYLINLMKERYNFRLKYKRIARGWAGRLPSGYRLGVLGIIARGEVDIGDAASYNKISRHDEFDSYHHSYKFECAFTYIITSDVIKSSASANFLSPFTWAVWGVVLIMLVTIVYLLKVTYMTHAYFDNERPESIMAFVMDVVAAIAQQGVNFFSEYTPSRVILFTLIVSTFLLYNYYTSSVIGALLSSNVRGPENIRDIVDSPLELTFQDVGYIKVLFRESQSPLVRELYAKKVLSRIHASKPVYTDLQTGVQLIKKGGNAFHCELVTVYPVIAKYFDAIEICKLRTVSGLTLSLDLNMVQTKRSPYTEMLKTAVIRLQEVGLVDKSLRIIRRTTPICQSAADVEPITFFGVSVAFWILLCGISTSIVLMMLEILYSKWLNNRGRLFNYVN